MRLQNQTSGDDVSQAWKVIAASVRGASHEKSDKPCQDSHYWLLLSSEGFVAAVADGAGSADLSQIGSAIASRIAVETFCNQIDEVNDIDLATDDELRAALGDSIKEARKAVEEEAKARVMSARDLATTLILFVATRSFAACIQVGDGATVVNDRTGQTFSLTTPRRGEYINETTFLTSPEAIETAQIAIWRGEVAQLAAFTDGLQMLALQTPDWTPYSPFFLPLFHFMADMRDEGEATDQLEKFLNSPRIRDHADDDLTLLVATLTN